MKSIKVLVIGQTPPPYHGQAMMTQRLVQADLEGVKIYHVRLSLSQSIKSLGKIEPGKILHMLSVVGKAVRFKFKYNIKVLYFMPAGPNLAPVLRDFIMLSILRLFYPKVIFHFRAAGLSGFIDKQSPFVKWLGQRIYRAPDLAIRLSSYSPNDGAYFGAKKNMVINNGLEDAARPFLPISHNPKEIVNILFVGSIGESKGVMVLLQAVKQLHERGYQIKLSLVGDFASEDFKAKVMAFCQQAAIQRNVHFAGVKIDQEKWAYFLDADIFCFPSFYESESFPSVVIEAMMFELPVVATLWRGIPDIVDDGATGILVPVKAADKTASALQTLISNHALRIKMGKAGRQKYVQSFQLDVFLNNMQSAFRQI